MYPGYDVFYSIFSRRFWRQILPSDFVILLLKGGSIYETFLGSTLPIEPAVEVTLSHLPPAHKCADYNIQKVFRKCHHTDSNYDNHVIKLPLCNWFHSAWCDNLCKNELWHPAKVKNWIFILLLFTMSNFMSNFSIMIMVILYILNSFIEIGMFMNANNFVA